MEYLCGSAKGIKSTYRDIEYYAPLINALFDHPKFRFDWAEQVKDGILKASGILFSK